MSNTDLIQYNGTQQFPATADVGTGADPYLEPQDGKYITAVSNNALEAPVQPVLNRIKDLLLGLRAATIGDFAGAVRRTFNSLEVDGIGGVVSALGGGTVKCTTLLAQAGTVSGGGTSSLVLAPSSVDAQNTAGGTANFGSIRVQWTNTTAGVSNPAKTLAAANKLYPLNVCKYWITFSTDGVGGITYEDGFGGATLTIAGAKIVVTFPSNFDNILYAVVGNAGSAGANFAFHVDPADKLVGSAKIKIGAVDPATTAVYGQCLIFGRQTT